MKRLMLVLLCLSLAALAQQQVPVPMAAQTNIVERGQAPTYSDMYCAGFMSKQAISHGNYIVAGLNSPTDTQFAQRDIVYLEGSGYQEGAQFSVIRELHDPNHSPAFSGQGLLIGETGQPYADLGRVRVIAVRGNTAVATVEFSCTAMVAGDLLVPFQARPEVAYRAKRALEQFPTGPGSLSARIVMAKDFDTLLGAGNKAYINAGSDKGVKPGDYFRVVRGYDPATMDPVDALYYKLPGGEDTQKGNYKTPIMRYASLPRHTVGEMIVLSATPSSATAMVTYSLESINVGDTVEMEPSVPIQQPPPQLPPPQLPPTISSCSADPSTVRSGQPSTITAVGQSPDNRPLTYSFTVSTGRVRPSGAQATLDTVGVPAGPVNVICTATDDRGLSANSNTSVNVEVPPPPPQASKCGSIEFSRDQRRPARVDNEAKAILDDCALRLQREAGAHAVIVGNADPSEKNAPNMAEQRALNTKDYLVREKGIDPGRLEIRSGSGGTQTVDIWVVPAGATF